MRRRKTPHPVPGRSRPADRMGRMRSFLRLKWILLAAAVVVGIRWLVYIPYDPQAIYRPVPASASLVGRYLDLPARWGDLLENPLALALMRTAGADAEGAAELVTDEESRAWFEKLAGREGTLAYLPGRFGGPPAWMAVSHLGGESQKLRWQLSLFKVPGFTRMTQFPGRSVWLVNSPDLEPGQRLVIAFGEGVLMACLSANPFAITEVLGAYDGTVARLLEVEPEFARFAAGDDRRVPDRFWVRDESKVAASESPGITVDIPVLRGEQISIRASTRGLDMVVEDCVSSGETGELARLLREAPCAAAVVKPAQLREVLARPEWPRHVRHALRMVADVANGDLVAVLMDGDLGGRMTLGLMRKLGLSGLRVPTLLLATRSTEAAAAAAIQQVLDASNARYRAAFVLRPVSLPSATLYVLESAGGNEWVDELARSDRPAYGVVDGWLLAASNLDALQKLVQGARRQKDVPGESPLWAREVALPAPVTVWLDLARSGKMAKDAIATWSLAQMFMDGGNSLEIREQLNTVKAWIDAFVPFGTARAELGRRNGRTELSIGLGLSADEGPVRMDAP